MVRATFCYKWQDLCGPEQIVNSVKLVLALHLFLKTLSPTSDVFRELTPPQSLTFTTPALSQKFSWPPFFYSGDLSGNVIHECKSWGKRCFHAWNKWTWTMFSRFRKGFVEDTAQGGFWGINRRSPRKQEGIKMASLGGSLNPTLAVF